MIGRVEKLSLLSEMIAFAKREKFLKAEDYFLLYTIANQLDISKDDFEYLLAHPISYDYLTTHETYIVQFHRLILLKYINNDYALHNLHQVYNIGLKMGLNFRTVNRVLELIYSFPNNVISFEFLTAILKEQYN